MDLPVFMTLAILSTLIGTTVGVITGLLPGLHTNNIAALMVMAHVPIALWALSTFEDIGMTMAEADLLIVCLLVSAAITHTFVNFVPATFLGAPEGETALSVLPGHRMLLEGRGHAAVRLSAQGSIGALIICIMAALVLRCLMGGPLFLYERFKPFIPAILLLVVILLILSEGNALKGRPGPSRKGLRVALLVEEVTQMEEGHTLRHIRPLTRVWNLPGLQGRTVLTKGVLVREEGGPFLKDRDTIPLVFGDGAEDDLVKGLPEGSKLWVKGKVCRTIKEGPRWTGMSWALLVFGLSGVLGLGVLEPRGMMNVNWVPVSELGLAGGAWMLMPMFTGLFGISTLLLSVRTNPTIPLQVIDTKKSLGTRAKSRGLLVGTMAGALVGWYPGITSAEAGVLAAQATSYSEDGNRTRTSGARTEEFIVSVSAINTANAISNFVALFVILRARSGSARAAQDILGQGLVPWTGVWDVPFQLLVILISVLVSGVLAYFATVKIGLLFARNFRRIKYRPLVLTVIMMLICLVFAFSGLLGMAIMSIGTVIGLIPPMVGVKRVHLMGCLILPLLLTWGGSVLPGGWYL